MSGAPPALVHALLASWDIPHGFGLRDSPPPDGLLRPRQVHGADVALVSAALPHADVEADAIVSTAPRLPVGVVTADCVPILLAGRSGRVVAAVHAGWRGLAAGVVAAGLRALRARAVPGEEIRAVIGPHIGACCYEVDEPVVDALGRRFDAVERALRPARERHYLLGLAVLVRQELEREGVESDAIGAIEAACTRCDATRFHSYRRDGPSAGRLVHYVAVPPLAARGEA